MSEQPARMFIPGKRLPSPQADEERTLAVARMIHAKPGCTVSYIGRETGYSDSAVLSALMQLDRRGMLLAEDERGGLSFLSPHIVERRVVT